jgi:hypothetical protein
MVIPADWYDLTIGIAVGTRLDQADNMTYVPGGRVLSMTMLWSASFSGRISSFSLRCFNNADLNRDRLSIVSICREMNAKMERAASPSRQK